MNDEDVAVLRFIRNVFLGCCAGVVVIAVLFVGGIGAVIKALAS